jgi:hypothetical protein
MKPDDNASRSMIRFSFGLGSEAHPMTDVVVLVSQITKTLRKG